MFKGETRDKVGLALGVSGKTFGRMKQVVDDCVPGLVDAMDDTKAQKLCLTD